MDRREKMKMEKLIILIALVIIYRFSKIIYKREKTAAKLKSLSYKKVPDVFFMAVTLSLIEIIKKILT